MKDAALFLVESQRGQKVELDLLKKLKVLKANPYHDELGRFTFAEYAVSVSTGGVFRKMTKNVRYVRARALVEAKKSLKQEDVWKAHKDFVKFITNRKDYYGRNVYTPEEVTSIRESPGENWEVWRDFAQNRLGYALEARSTYKKPYLEFEVKNFLWREPSGQDVLLKNAMVALDANPAKLKLKIIREPTKFMLNGVERDYAGHYIANAGPGVSEIGMYPNVISTETSALEVLLHEHGHHKFAQSKPELQDFISDKDDEMSGQQEGDDQYPYTTRLMKTGPQISDYAADWWKHATREPSDFIRAVNETLAEINQLRPIERKTIAPEWLELYNQMNANFHEIVDGGMENAGPYR